MVSSILSLNIIIFFVVFVTGGKGYLRLPLYVFLLIINIYKETTKKNHIFLCYQDEKNL